MDGGTRSFHMCDPMTMPTRGATTLCGSHMAHHVRPLLAAYKWVVCLIYVTQDLEIRAYRNLHVLSQEPSPPSFSPIPLS